MADFELVIRNGTVATAADTMRADIGVRGGRIVATGERLERGTKEIDASGLLVLPGGIDSHTHIDQPMGGGIVMADDFESGTRAAAAGGNTSILSFALQIKGESLRECLTDYHRRAEGKCHTDHAFHLIVSDPTEQVLGQELPALVRDGYTSFKVYMTYDDLKLNDRQLIDVLDLARRERALVMVHAENDDAIKYMVERLELEGRTSPRHHADARPMVVEREATHRAISLAELIDVPMVIVHVSGRDSMEQIRWAQQRGLKIFAETCPQYLVLTARDLDGLGMEGAKYVCSPPPRDEASQAACWEGLQQGVFQLFSSDHTPFYFADERGKSHPKAKTSFRWVPNGIPGIETRLPILFSEGVSKGRIDLNRFVALSATNHAKMYGLYPRKGTIAIGSDADLTLWDPNRNETIRQEILHHGPDYTPYEGLEVKGWPIVTIIRGQVVAEEGRIVGAPGFGSYLSRTISPHAAVPPRSDA